MQQPTINSPTLWKPLVLMNRQWLTDGDSEKGTKRPSAVDRSVPAHFEAKEQSHHQRRPLQLRRRFLPETSYGGNVPHSLSQTRPAVPVQLCRCVQAGMKHKHVCLEHIQTSRPHSSRLTKDLPNVRTVSEPRWAVAPPLPTTHSGTDCSTPRHVYTVIHSG